MAFRIDLLPQKTSDVNPRADLIRLEERLSAGPYGHRAGDVLLLAKSGLERPIEDRNYFSSEYRSWHGHPSAQDSYVPLLIGILPDWTPLCEPN